MIFVPVNRLADSRFVVFYSQRFDIHVLWNSIVFFSSG